MTLHKKSHFVP